MSMDVMRMWIKDRDQSPQGFPLQRLLRAIRGLFFEEAFEVHVYRADGYGFQINTWAAQLEEKTNISVDVLTLDSLSEGKEEWFYSLDAHLFSESLSIRVGLHDSSALYVEATENVLSKLEKLFLDVIYAKPDSHNK